ncbi:hypothetical protein Patl1_29884 [Pistacia atlantica]|uniref:Uncharacterized protein n=1 Tax=Pistacia atlantica TaxID=434234 RepID=A0ACC1AAW6_9ROSI|nr:hypothetical protein Patl1_29884 [Pistacia atlantica]
MADHLREDDRDAAYPSLSFVNNKDRDTPIMTHKAPLYTPKYQSHMGQQIVKLEATSCWYVVLWNWGSQWAARTDRKENFSHGIQMHGVTVLGTTSLYQSHPWVLAVLPNGEALGILADTTRRCEIDLRKELTIQLIAPSPYPVITFGPFTSPSAVLVSLSHATGTIFMPPKWSLGYHQCRWSYDSDKRVLEVSKTFREKGIPCDVIWMDIDYMDGFRCFTFDKEHFSDPKSLVKDLHHIGFKAIWMLDPGIKHEDGYFVYDSGAKSDVWIKKADGTPFVGEVWPGPCVFPDFTQSKTRSWWASLVKDFVSNGVDGIWNDMNEPAVFKSVTKTMPESNIHNGDKELGNCQNHSHYHNVYGMLMARSTHEGMKLADKNKRPFVLTRAGFVGSQRYAATWTGDNLSTWEHLHMSISMVLQLGLSGQPLSGPDIGGFEETQHPNFLDGGWVSVPCFLFVVGTLKLTLMTMNPGLLVWSSVDQCEEVCRLALRRRYRLLPHIYTLFYIAHTTGVPVATPTFFADPKDPSLRTLENSFLLGPLLVCASSMPDQSLDKLQCTLPKGIWQIFDFDDSHPDLPALYLQGGSIVPVGPPHQHVGESDPSDDLTLLVALDENGKAKGILFEDDGDGYGFTEGQYLLTHYVAELQESVVTVRISGTEGSWKRPQRRLNVKFLLGEGTMVSLTFIESLQNEVSNLVSASKEQYKTRLENAKPIPDVEKVSGQKGTELSKTPIELKSGDWALKVVPWIGGRIISMEHLPSAYAGACLNIPNVVYVILHADHSTSNLFVFTGSQWLHSRIEINGYEEYCGTEYRSIGCTEEYNVIE